MCPGLSMTKSLPKDLKEASVGANISMQIIDDPLFDKKLNTNMSSLSEEITQYCDELIDCIRRRKMQLLNQVDSVRMTKKYCVQQVDFKAMKNIQYINEVNTGSCLRFVSDENIVNLLNNFGYIDEERACAANSRVTGLDLAYAIVNEPIQFELETQNKSGEVSWVEQDNIVASLEKDGQPVNCVVQNRCNGVYTVMCELPEVGDYHINIHVNGNIVPGCPYTLKSFEREEIKFTESEDNMQLTFNIGEIKFTESEDNMQLTFNIGEKTAFVEKSESYQILHLCSDILSPVHAWKVKVTTACRKIKVKCGYAYNTRYIPDLREEFCKKFDLSTLLNKTKLGCIPIERQHTHKNGGRRRRERRQSTYERNSLTFFIVHDTNKKLIHIAVEELKICHSIYYNKDDQFLEPFIGIKHFCTSSGCPRPMLALL